MKTPREILLEQHQGTASKLDIIRNEIVNSQFRHRNFAMTIWDELIWPCRRIWTGLAAVWILIFVFNLSQRDPAEQMARKSPPPSPEMILSFRQQEKLLAELIGPDEIRSATPPKPFFPQPRSEGHIEILMT